MPLFLPRREACNTPDVVRLTGLREAQAEGVVAVLALSVLPPRMSGPLGAPLDTAHILVAQVRRCPELLAARFRRREAQALKRTVAQCLGSRSPFRARLEQPSFIVPRTRTQHAYIDLLQTSHWNSKWAVADQAAKPE